MVKSPENRVDTLMRRFAARLHSLRMERNFTQEALSAKSKLHQGYISALERSRQIPSLSTLDQLAKGLGVELSALLDFPDKAGSSDDRKKEEIAIVVRLLQKADLKLVKRIRKSVEALTES
jgi:transcriptional regulator with XRE-family HTH domain